MISLIHITPRNLGLYQDDILAIERASFPSPWGPSAFQGEAGNDVSNFWVLLLDGETAAYVCFWMFLDEIHLLSLAVHPGRRRMGLGRHLMDRMIALGLASGVEKVWLEVRPSNTPARELYHKYGFRGEGRRQGYYDDTREDALIMTLSLEAPMQMARGTSS
ncbi:MAG: ribosomal protein S18-alanine N-acetyltransferase [Deltaproteobacteria bacterium]|nr:ribosomal protein S18-alanine N-acetyltransferase [Deltaproteobacteria bacterium]